MSFDAAIEEQILHLGRGILKQVRGRTARHTFDHRAFAERLLSEPELKTQLLRLVDVLPTLENDAQLAEHLYLYLGQQNLPIRWPGLARWGLQHGRHGIGAGLSARAARIICRKMARGFILGQSVAEIEPRLRRMFTDGLSFSLDVLGEACTGEAAALAYQQTYLQLIPELSLRLGAWGAANAAGPHGAGARPNRSMHGVMQSPAGAAGTAPATPPAAAAGTPSPRLHLSIKLSGLYSQLRPVDPDGSVQVIKDRLRPILLAARAAGAFILVDSEQFDYRAITLRAFKELLVEDGLRDFKDVGIAMQAYLCDTPLVVASLIAWAKDRGTPITIRLVRGAYWDFERTLAEQNAWPSPVWQHKSQTDQTYEQCVELLLRNYPTVRTAIATHNLRSICVGAVLAESLGLTPREYEFQMLFGMSEDVATALVSRDLAVRMYCPFGPLLPGMAYLVRRLMENSSNESFVYRAGQTHATAAELMLPPQPPPNAGAFPAGPVAAPPGASAFANIPLRRFSIPEQHAAFHAAVESVRPQMPMAVYPHMDGKRIDRPVSAVAVNPSHPEMVVGKIAPAQLSDVQTAMTAASRALDAWRNRPVDQRAQMLERAAAWLAEHRDMLAAWQIFEAGKPWIEADADVCEAVDHIRYAAHEARRLFNPIDLSVSGESQTYTYLPRGIAAVIAPWNFPLAIVAGMTAAALATGNTVIVKPAPQTPVSAQWLIHALQVGGLPAGVVNFLPGGDEIGKALVAHRDMALIAFTGSEAVGREIIASAALVQPGQRHFKHVIAEMGGKNAMIIDDDADMDVAIPEIVASAFGYAGQKCSACSRLIVLSDIYDRLLEKLLDAVASVCIGPSESPSTYMGPVIDSAAQRRLMNVIEKGRSEARVLFQAVLPDGLDGFYVPPTIFVDVPPDGVLAQEEMFGPVLCVFRAGNMADAVALANNTRYGLTAGLMSRNPQRIDLVRRTLEAGNIYINRRITGAVVNRQPFGGMKLSSLGSKAGGPDYLLQFVQARVVTENTIRHGFVPPGG